ncbi:hypothetical protein B0H13DRAFT_2436863, partial [Mycena leptocephala]
YRSCADSDAPLLHSFIVFPLLSTYADSFAPTPPAYDDDAMLADSLAHSSIFSVLDVICFMVFPVHLSLPLVIIIGLMMIFEALCNKLPPRPPSPSSTSTRSSPRSTRACGSGRWWCLLAPLCFLGPRTAGRAGAEGGGGGVGVGGVGLVFEDMGLAVAMTSKGGEVETEEETMNDTSTGEEGEGDITDAGSRGTGTESFLGFSGVRLLNVNVDARPGSMTTLPYPTSSHWFLVSCFPLSHRIAYTYQRTRLVPLSYLFLSTYTTATSTTYAPHGPTPRPPSLSPSPPWILRISEP